jgi:glycosyltransferase involved in cell wall biosynthesis
MRVGGGTRFKALEAMAAAKPIVSTSLGVEGIPVAHERELLLADTPAAFADSVLRLLQELPAPHGLATQLGMAGRQLVAAHYTWDTIVPELERVYAELQANRTAISRKTHEPGVLI